MIAVLPLLRSTDAIIMVSVRMPSPGAIASRWVELSPPSKRMFSRSLPAQGSWPEVSVGRVCERDLSESLKMDEISDSWERA